MAGQQAVAADADCAVKSPPACSAESLVAGMPCPTQQHICAPGSPCRLGQMTIDLMDMFKRHGYDDAFLFGHALEGNLHLVFSQVLARSVQAVCVCCACMLACISARVGIPSLLACQQAGACMCMRACMHACIVRR